MPALHCHYVNTDAMGYGRMAVRLVAALRKLGVTVYDARSENAPTTNHVNWMSIPAHARSWLEGQDTSILTMWESMRLAEGMVEGLDNFRLVMVPSEQNVELFSDFHDNVKLVSLGVDEQWHYRPRQEPGTFFTFLCGGSGPRKGVDLVTQAFRKVFGDFAGDGPIPRLVMKSPRGAEGFDVGEGIELVAGKISGEEELDLYASAHCYVQPSRGEGFGFQPLQAIAQGVPTILTDAHGHQAFAKYGIGLSARAKKAEYFTMGFAGDWWEPDFDELCEQMRWVYDNWDTASDMAARNAPLAAEEFSWEHSARMFLDAIGEENLTRPYIGSGQKVEAELRRFKVIVTEPWKADIAGIHYSFIPGEVYWEPADVLRILFDSGKLHPDCLDGNKGLSQSQVDRLGRYSAAHSWCPTCQQQLNTEVTKGQFLLLQREKELLEQKVAELTARLAVPQ